MRRKRFYCKFGKGSTLFGQNSPRRLDLSISALSGSPTGLNAEGLVDKSCGGEASLFTVGHVFFLKLRKQNRKPWQDLINSTILKMRLFHLLLARYHSYLVPDTTTLYYISK